MSKIKTDKSKKKIAPVAVHTGNDSPFDKDALAAFVNERMTSLKISINDIERRTKLRGEQFSVAATTVHHLRKGTFANPKPRTLRNLAYALDVSEQEILDVAYGRGINGDIPQYLTRELTVPDKYWEAFYEAAKTHKRSPDEEFEALIAATLCGEAVNFDQTKILRYHTAGRG